MDSKEIKRELNSYNDYLYSIENYKLELIEKELKFKEATEPTLGGFSSEINSDIRSKNKKSESLLNQAINNISKEAYYKKEVEIIKSKILMFQQKVEKVKSMIELIDKAENRELIKKKYIEGVSVNDLADELSIDVKSVYKRMDESIKKLESRIKVG